MPALWLALRDVVLFWVDQGVRIFRVDNPHTKPLPFWEWMIADVRGRHPDVIFLAEAFTRPKMMYRLAKVGFSQSYTYFTWRNTKQELTEYLDRADAPPVRRSTSGRTSSSTRRTSIRLSCRPRAAPGFLIRAALAATLSGLWGMYTGFELCEAAPLPGREEYLDSEKYEIRVRDFDRARATSWPRSRALNRIRRAQPGAAEPSRPDASTTPSTTRSCSTARRRRADDDMILVAVSLDPHQRAGGGDRGAAVGMEPAGRRRARGRGPDARPPLRLARQDAAHPARSRRAAVRASGASHRREQRA